MAGERAPISVLERKTQLETRIRQRQTLYHNVGRIGIHIEGQGTDLQDVRIGDIRKKIQKTIDLASTSFESINRRESILNEARTFTQELSVRTERLAEIKKYVSEGHLSEGTYQRRAAELDVFAQRAKDPEMKQALMEIRREHEAAKAAVAPQQEVVEPTTVDIPRPEMPTKESTDEVKLPIFTLNEEHRSVHIIGDGVERTVKFAKKKLWESLKYFMTCAEPLTEEEIDLHSELHDVTMPAAHVINNIRVKIEEDFRRPRLLVKAKDKKGNDMYCLNVRVGIPDGDAIQLLPVSDIPAFEKIPAEETSETAIREASHQSEAVVTQEIVGSLPDYHLNRSANTIVIRIGETTFTKRIWGQLSQELLNSLLRGSLSKEEAKDLLVAAGSEATGDFVKTNIHDLRKVLRVGEVQPITLDAGIYSIPARNIRITNKDGVEEIIKTQEEMVPVEPTEIVRPQAEINSAFVEEPKVRLIDISAAITAEDVAETKKSTESKEKKSRMRTTTELPDGTKIELGLLTSGLIDAVYTSSFEHPVMMEDIVMALYGDVADLKKARGNASTLISMTNLTNLDAVNYRIERVGYTNEETGVFIKGKGYFLEKFERDTEGNPVRIPHRLPTEQANAAMEALYNDIV